MRDNFEIHFKDQSLSAATDLDRWLLDIKIKIGSRILENLHSETDHLDRYIECAELKELPGTFMCCSFYQADINEALTRAGLFMGAAKGTPAGTVTPQENRTLINYKKLVAGHNLPGSIVIDFFGRPHADLNVAESAFREHFVRSGRLSAHGSSFYVIGFSIQSTKEQRSVVSHEIYHAYYFLRPAYRAAVQRFWREVVTAEDRAAITQEIGRAYNVTDEDLVIDEFQAYLVQTGAEKDRVRQFVPKYREQMFAALDTVKARPPAF